MDCLHPFCPMAVRSGAPDWSSVLDRDEMKLKPAERPSIAAFFDAHFRSLGPLPFKLPSSWPIKKAALRRLLDLCPCLYSQISEPPSAKAVVHLCEVTLGARIDASNVHDAFLIQHPAAGTPPMRFPPRSVAGSIGGDIMEYLCSEVLTSAGVPRMQLNKDKWPNWEMPGHISLNEGKMRAMKAFGDILIPCAPTNLIVSVKSESARERLLYSANSIEGVGFGFFNQPNEFWSASRMALFKRMGFSAIYMPDSTHAAVTSKVEEMGRERDAVNVNGTDLYRPFSQFGVDMKRVAGCSTLEL